jgi:hypothetical protein
MIVESLDFAFSMVILVKDLESFEEAHNHPEVDKKIKLHHAVSKE